jgi:hypothetical protein
MRLFVLCSLQGEIIVDAIVLVEVINQADLTVILWTL